MTDIMVCTSTSESSNQFYGAVLCVSGPNEKLDWTSCGHVLFQFVILIRNANLVALLVLISMSNDEIRKE